MTLVVLPEGTQKSGSSGGTTHSRNRFGAYERSRTVPVNPNTDRQVAVRNAVRSLTIAWQNTLTQAQRDAWETYADNIPWQNKLGQAVNLTGLNHYIRSNTPLVQNLTARVDIAPVIFNLAAAELNLQVVASEGTQILTVNIDDTAAWVAEVGAWQYISMGLPQNGSIKFFGGPYKQIRAVPGGGPPINPQEIPAAFPFAEGQRIWVRSRILRADGRLSEFAIINFLAAP